jgi:hypothetical protein
MWASVLGTTAAFGLAFGQQGGTEAPSGPPKVGEVISLKFRDGPDRQFKVLKVEKQADGGYLSEVQDVKSGETITLFDKGDYPPPKPQDAGKGKDAQSPKAKSRSDAQMQPPAAPASPDRSSTGASNKSASGNSSNPTPMPDSPKDPPKKPGFLARIFGKKPPQENKDSAADAKNPSMSGASNSTQSPVTVPIAPPMPPAVKPTPAFTSPPHQSGSTNAAPAPPPPASSSTGAAPFTPPPAAGTAEPPRVHSAPPVQPPAAQSAPAVPLFPRPETGVPSGPGLPAVPATPSFPAIPAVPATPASTPAPFPAMPPSTIPAIPATPPIPSPGMPNIPVPPGGGVSMSYPQLLQVRYATPEEVAMVEEIRPYVANLRGAKAPSDRIYAAWSLAGSRYGSNDAVKLLLFRSCTSDPCPLVRACCIDELSKLGYCTQEFTKYLTTACNDESPEVQKSAKKAMIQATPQR